MQTSRYHDYDVAKVLIAVWLLFITFGCICVAHGLMWFKETREHLGKLVKKNLPKTNSSETSTSSKVTEPNSEKSTSSKATETNSETSTSCKATETNSEKSTSCKVTEDEQRFFFFNQRVFFPMMLLAVIGATIGDIYLYANYRHNFSNKKDPLYLFPMPVIAPVFMVVNLIMTTITFIILRHQDRLKSISDYILTTGTLLLLFGITYLFYHGFWMIIALLAYPGRILIGGVFIVPAFVVTIPIWIMILKISNYWYNALSEALELVFKKECKCNYCKEGCKSNNCKEECKCNNCKEGCKCNNNKMKVLKPLCSGCGWLALLIVDIVFWVLFLAILYYISRFLLTTITLQDEKLKSALSYIAITAVSGVLLWINTDLVVYQKDNNSNEETKEKNTSAPPKKEENSQTEINETNESCV